MGGGAEDDGGQPPWMLMALAVDASLAVVLFFFFLFHLKMVLDNQTTIETEYEVPPFPEFDLGMRKNFEQVFGPDPWLWLLPVWGRGPVGNGIDWPTAGGQGLSWPRTGVWRSGWRRAGREGL